MQIETYTVFKKSYIPWYDSNAVCLLTIIFLSFVCAFSMVGIRLASSTPEFTSHVGVPATLLLLSGAVIFSITIRLIVRFFRRFDRQ